MIALHFYVCLFSPAAAEGEMERENTRFCYFNTNFLCKRIHLMWIIFAKTSVILLATKSHNVNHMMWINFAKQFTCYFTTYKYCSAFQKAAWIPLWLISQHHSPNCMLLWQTFPLATWIISDEQVAAQNGATSMQWKRSTAFLLVWCVLCVAQARTFHLDFFGLMSGSCWEYWGGSWSPSIWMQISLLFGFFHNSWSFWWEGIKTTSLGLLIGQCPYH